MSPKNDAAFLRMFLVILGALVAFTVLILFVANKVAAADGEDPQVRAAIAERIAPVGRVNVAPPAPAVAESAAAEPAAAEPAVADDAPAEPPAAPAASESAAAPVAAAPVVATAAPATDAAPVAAGRSGEEVYNAACTACHLVGVLGAPKLSDTAAWSARLDAAGIDGLVSSVINGKGNMPARAGANISDAEIRVAVDYMLTASGVERPASPPAAAVPAESGGSSAAPAPAVAEPAAAVAAVAASAASAAPGGAVAIDLDKGKTIYDTACFACHMTGAAGAPKLGDQALWGPRIAKGLDTLTHNAINGIGTMPPKGGRVDLPDADIASAVVYMIEQSK